MSKIGIIVIVLAVVAGGAFFYLQDEATPEERVANAFLNTLEADSMAFSGLGDFSFGEENEVKFSLNGDFDGENYQMETDVDYTMEGMSASVIFESIMVDSKTYLKVDTLPLPLMGFLPMDPGEISDRWIFMGEAEEYQEITEEVDEE